MALINGKSCNCDTVNMTEYVAFNDINNSYTLTGKNTVLLSNISLNNNNMLDNTINIINNVIIPVDVHKKYVYEWSLKHILTKLTNELSIKLETVDMSNKTIIFDYKLIIGSDRPMATLSDNKIYDKYVLQYVISVIINANNRINNIYIDYSTSNKKLYKRITVMGALEQDNANKTYKSPEPVNMPYHYFDIANMEEKINISLSGKIQGGKYNGGELWIISV